MIKFEDYAEKYRHVRLERRDGVLLVAMHSDGGRVRWGASIHEELGHVFHDIGADRGNKVVILTGTGEAFINAIASDLGDSMSPRGWDRVYWEGKKLLMNLLDIEVPMIAAVNGPATIHAELALLCDIVLAADHAIFQDAAHFAGGLVPGDGVHVIWPLLLGINRARYFLLTGQILSAKAALDLGIVGEVLPSDDLLPRAWALAGTLVKQPPLTLRYARVALTQNLKAQMHANLGYGLALEGLGAVDHWPTRKR